jgi:hypothetical protein
MNRIMRTTAEGEATVVAFVPAARRRVSGPSGAGPLGEILFFTGVRYERHDAASVPARAVSPGSGDLGDPRRSA